MNEEVKNDVDNFILAFVFALVIFVIAGAAHLRVKDANARQKKKENVTKKPRGTRRTRKESMLPASFAEMVWPPRETLCANILAGVVAGVKQSLGCVVFSSMVYNGCDVCYPELQSIFPIGVSVNLMSTAVGIFLCTGMSNYGGQVSPQDIPAMLLSRIAEVLAQMVEEDELQPTILAVTWINATVFGLILLACGHLRAGRVMRSFPGPVVDGFVAATGAMAIRSAVSTLSRTTFHNLLPTRLDSYCKWETWIHIVIGFLSVFCIRHLSVYIRAWINPKHKALNALLNPLCLLVPLFLFYIVLFLHGNVGDDLQFLRDHNLVYPKVSNQPFWKFYSSEYPNAHGPAVAWYALVRTEVLFLMAMLQFLSLIAATLSLVGMKCRLEGMEDMDLDKELFYLGIQNVIIGILGGSPSFHKLGVSVNLVKDGGTHRLADIVSGITVATVFLSGVPVSPYIPKFFLAAIFLNLGIEFTKDHLLDKWNRMSGVDFGTTLVVVLLALTRDMTWAVGGGLVLQVAILVMISSTLDPIRLQATSENIRSTRLRTSDERWVLSQSKCIEVICLRGPLFFGIAAKLVLQVEELLYNMEPMPNHIILNMDQVTAFDHSAAEAFMRIHQTAAKRRIQLNIVGADDWKWLLQLEGIIAKDSPQDDGSTPGHGVRGDYAAVNFLAVVEDHEAEEKDFKVANWFSSMDAALQTCEDDVLREKERRGELAIMRRTMSHRLTYEYEVSPSGELKPKLFKAVSNTSELEDEDIVAMSGMPAEDWYELMNQCEHISCRKGDKLYVSGDPCQEVYILTDGIVKLSPSNEDFVARQVSALGLLGVEGVTMRLAIREEDAEVTSETATVHKLTQECLDQMRAEQKDLYIAWSELRSRALCTARSAMPPL